MPKTAIWITLSPSKFADGWHLLSHLVPFILLLLYLPLTLITFLLCGAFVGLAWYASPARWRSQAIQQLRYDEGVWHLTYHDGKTTRALLFRSALFTDRLIWCCFIEASGRSCRLMIWPDSASAEARRQLRVLLRLAV